MRRRLRSVMILGSRYDAFVFGQAVDQDAVLGVDQCLASDAEWIQPEGADDAIDLARSRQIDLVLSSMCLPGEDTFELVRELKALLPHVPAVAVTSNPAYHGPLCQVPPTEPYDWVFAWRGEDDLIPAIVMLLEDRLNAEHDVLVGGVQIMLLVEDEPALYSRYVPMLLREMCQRSRDLVPPGAPRDERVSRLRARTKLILVRTFEEAALELSRYGASLCGVLTDMQYPRNGRLDNEAGLHLARHAKQHVRESIPVIVQSRDREMEPRAHEAGAFFIWKNSDLLLHQLRDIMMDYFGFGGFIFRGPDGAEVGRAHDLDELAAVLERMPFEVFDYHGRRDHFSTWLFIHGEHELARRLRVIKEVNEESRAQAVEMIRSAAIRAAGRRSWVPSPGPRIG
jgi:CheY-like chemotaxis protein